mgnify:CR=1 FL=1
MWLFVLPLAVVILDQFSKYIVVENMALGESIPIIEEVFHLTYILNPGAAFGMFAHHPSVFYCHCHRCNWHYHLGTQRNFSVAVGS